MLKPDVNTLLWHHTKVTYPALGFPPPLITKTVKTAFPTTAIDSPITVHGVFKLVEN